MKLEQITALGRKLTKFVGRFEGCFERDKALDLLQAYVSGQLTTR